MNKMNKMKIKASMLKSVITLFLVFIITSLAFAQPGPTDDPNPDAGVPLEGADFLLLAMAGGYVIIKLWQYQHKKKSQQQKIPQ